MPLLEVNDLTVEYHTEDGVFRAVEGLSFHLEPGKSIGIVGESGCGKTTAMLAILRLLPEVGRIMGGEAILDGTDLLSLSPNEFRKYRWDRLSMVFQGAMNALNPVYTVGRQIEDTLLLHESVSKKVAKKEVERLLDLVGVSSSFSSKYPHEYSGGMRQRAMIAMALACNPQVLIADEPTTALDVMVQAQILDLLKELQDELNLSVVLVTHDLGAVAEICDDVLVMYGGQLAEYADADIIYNKAAHPYTQRLLKAFPDIDNPDAELDSIPGHPPPLDNLPSGCRFEPRCGVSIEICAPKTPPVVEVAPGHFVRCLLVKDFRS